MRVDLLCSLIDVYYIVLIARILLSRFPVQAGTAIASIDSILYDLTEPVLGPLRPRILPLGMLDPSPLIVFIGLSILRGLLGCGRGMF